MDERSNPRVVIVFPGALGDLVLAADALAALRPRHPGATTTLAVNGGLVEIARASGVADAYASLDDADASGLFGGSRLPDWFGRRPRLYAWVGSRDAGVRDRLRSLALQAAFFAVVRDDGPEHATSAYARQVGATPGRVGALWRIPRPSARVAAVSAGGGGRLLVLHAGAGSPRKRWGREGFVAVARRWEEAGGVVVELVGPAEEALPRLGVPAVAGLSLGEVLAVLAAADAYVGNDSGISHLAGVAGTHGVAVFGATPARRWAPRHGRLLVVEAETRSTDGSDDVAVAPDAVWQALARSGCLDKVQGRK